MKVRELIEDLLKADQDAEVVVNRSEDFAPDNLVPVVGVFDRSTIKKKKSEQVEYTIQILSE